MLYLFPQASCMSGIWQVSFFQSLFLPPMPRGFHRMSRKVRQRGLAFPEAVQVASCLHGFWYSGSWLQLPHAFDHNDGISLSSVQPAEDREMPSLWSKA